MSDGLGQWVLNELSDSATQSSLGLKYAVSVDGVEAALKRAATNTKPVQIEHLHKCSIGFEVNLKSHYILCRKALA